MDIISKMCGILLVIFSLIGASAAGMSQATTTREFRRCFPKSWVSADRVRVSCNDTLIAQNCSPDRSCRNMSKPGVSLQKGSDRVCLTITNCSYDSWSCKAQSYISDEQMPEENFNVSVCNQPTSTSPSPGNNEPHSASDEAVWGLLIVLIIFGLIIVLIIFGLIIVLIIYFCYKKVKCFRKAIRDIFGHFPCMNRAPEEEQDIELEKEKEKFLESPNHGAK